MQKIQSFDWLHLKFKFQIFKFKTASTPSHHFVLLCLLVFVVILVDSFGFPVFCFHKDKEITKKIDEIRLSCTRLNFDEILFAGTKRAVPGGQYRSILPARMANQYTEFAAHCPLAELVIYSRTPLFRTIILTKSACGPCEAILANWSVYRLHRHSWQHRDQKVERRLEKSVLQLKTNRNEVKKKD